MLPSFFVEVNSSITLSEDVSVTVLEGVVDSFSFVIVGLLDCAVTLLSVELKINTMPMNAFAVS